MTTRPLRVYVAGPMRGRPAFNFPAFDAATARLRAEGHEVFSPAEHDRTGGFDPTGMTGHEDLAALGFDLRAALAVDLAWITGEADAIYLLDGWESSSGARAELAAAAALGLLAREHTGEWRPAGEVLAHATGGAVLPSSGEVRVVSDTGGAKGTKPARFDLIPAQEEWELAEHYGKGAAKYERVNGLDNWRNGYPWSLSYAALRRHLNAFWRGEDVDPETGSKHTIAVAWHALALSHFLNRPDLARFDDRQEPICSELGRQVPADDVDQDLVDEA
jgi:hypothetical protein